MKSTQDSNIKNSDYKRKIIESLHKHEDIIQDEAGFWVFWPNRKIGAISSHELCIIADYLDKLNAPWQKQINEYFEQQKE